MTPAYDFAIAGGGVSGLTLACHLALRFPEKRLLLADKNPRDLDRRNLSFWADRPTLFDAAARGTWAQLDVRTPHFTRRFDLGDYRYRSILGADFAACARRILAAHPNVTQIEADIRQITDDADCALLHIDNDRIPAAWAFDGRLLAEDTRPHKGALLLHQHFLGYEIETDTDSFDPAAPRFLDFAAPQDDAVRFFYMLPFSPRRALIELVVHGAEPAESMLRDYIRAHQIESFRLVDTESGQSPLTDYVHPRRVGPRTMAIGIHGGRLKASTGYAFTRIQRDSAWIAGSLESHGHPFHVPPDRRLYRLLDQVMLRLMHNRPARVGPAFEAMFRHNPIHRLLRFLDEDASLFEILRVAWKMPAAPFMGEVFRWIFGGRRPARQ